MGNNQTSEQTMNTITIKNITANKTEAEIDAGIDEALADAVKNGLIVPTGKTQWSERRQCMIPVYKSLVYRHCQVKLDPSRQAQQIHNLRLGRHVAAPCSRARR
jgi:hypothetical protein